MALVRIQTVIRMSSNIPADAITNTIVIEAGNVEDAPTGATVAIKAFYDTIRPHLSNVIAQTGHQCKFYLVDQPEPNYPYSEETWDFDLQPAGPPLPSEVALCTSFQALKVNGVSQASRRGRLYIGPLSVNANSSGRPAQAFVDDLVNATQALVFAIKSLTVTPEAPSDFMIYSPKLGTASSVADGWVDNAFDTQRSRGVETTSRTVWDLGSDPV